MRNHELVVANTMRQEFNENKVAWHHSLGKRL